MCVYNFYNGHDRQRRWRSSPWISAWSQLCGARVNRIDHAAWLHYIYVYDIVIYMSFLGNRLVETRRFPHDFSEKTI